MSRTWATITWNPYIYKKFIYVSSTLRSQDEILITLTLGNQETHPYSLVHNTISLLVEKSRIQIINADTDPGRPLDLWSMKVYIALKLTLGDPTNLWLPLKLIWRFVHKPLWSLTDTSTQMWLLANDPGAQSGDARAWRPSAAWKRNKSAEQC